MGLQAVHFVDTGNPARAVVHLLGGPHVMYGGDHFDVPQGSRRLLAFVTLAGGRVERPYSAGALWPFGDDDRAAGNLRSALWRLRRSGIDVLVADKWSLTLDEDVAVDVRLLGEWASRLLHGMPLPQDLTLAHLPTDALHLLPGYHDDWVIIERERIRQRMLHAMEALSRHLTSAHRLEEAIHVARTAIAAEPLRESAQRVLVEAQLAYGSRADACRTLTSFRALLHSELGIGPSSELSALMARLSQDPGPVVSTGARSSTPSVSISRSARVGPPDPSGDHSSLRGPTGTTGEC